jgi:8-oxo-dGTP pyrophosphatase MutT (NUDIX family)
VRVAHPHIDAVSRALAGGGGRRLPPPARVRDRAGVALVLAGEPDDLRLCFIRRVQREGDPWSGQMAFPGGRACADDPTPRDAAEREVLEEVGIDLRRASFLGALDEVPLRRVVKTDAVLSPFVYAWVGPRPELVPDAREVAAAFWTPLADLWHPGNRTIVRWVHDDVPMRFPGIAHGDDVIWGLTYRVLESFAQRVGHPLVT